MRAFLAGCPPFRGLLSNNWLDNPSQLFLQPLYPCGCLGHVLPCGTDRQANRGVASGQPRMQPLCHLNAAFRTCCVMNCRIPNYNA